MDVGSLRRQELLPPLVQVWVGMPQSIHIQCQQGEGSCQEQGQLLVLWADGSSSGFWGLVASSTKGLRSLVAVLGYHLSLSFGLFWRFFCLSRRYLGQPDCKLSKSHKDHKDLWGIMQQAMFFYRYGGQAKWCFVLLSVVLARLLEQIIAMCFALDSCYPMLQNYRTYRRQNFTVPCYTNHES